MHKLLKRQIERYCRNPHALPPEMEKLLEAISATYEQNDNDRAMLEHSLDVVSAEMSEQNAALAAELRERQAAEQALRASESLYRSLGEALPMALFRMKSGGEIVYGNKQVAASLGMSESEIVGRNMFDLVPDEGQRALAREQHRKVIEEGASFTEVEPYIVPATGEQRYLEIIRGPVHDDEGKIVGEQSTFRDVTEQIRNQRQLVAAREEIERQRNFLRHVLDLLPHCVYARDRNGRYILANQAMADFLETTVENIVGKTHEEFGSNPEIAAQIRRSDREVFRTGCDVRIAEQPFTDARGRSGCFNIVKRPLIGADGQVDLVIGLSTDISEHKLAQEQIRHLALHDQLTGLPNRGLLRDHAQVAIEEARHKGRQLAILYLDLDRFKNVNDSLGHEFGDKLLREAAHRLVATARPGDTVSRHGGDEFVVMLRDIADARDVRVLSRKLIDAMGAPFGIDGKELILTLSIGVSMYPTDGEEVDALLRCADTALYAAKEGGRNQYRFFAAEMHAQASQRLQLETELRRALERQELFLQYQPQFDLRDGRIIGSEALVRWRHPVRGLVPPDQFIPLAEDSGLIGEIGAWVMETACCQHAAWLASGKVDGTVSINVSGHQFRQRGFVATVLACLRKSGLRPPQLELEVTESVLMQNSAEVIDKLNQLSELGVRLSIDDFGTGYSSLNYLKQFPLDQLKIDRTFVQELPFRAGDKAIVRAVISLGRDLGFDVLAEGIETQDQLRFLRDAGCNAGQGFIFSRPLMSADYVDFVRAHPAPPPNDEKVVVAAFDRRKSRMD